MCLILLELMRTMTAHKLGGTHAVLSPGPPAEAKREKKIPKKRK